MELFCEKITTKTMLTKFAKDSIIDIWQSFECTPECNTMKSQKKSCTRSDPENGNFQSLEYRRY